ncbi:autotransporter adhesin [Avibacterium avium]|uniref:Autotransporter adhesin n=2 Tax=Avibacterium avium TaxID=751 RepID=A0A379AP53_AVIAV|nr:autotransporter adhesin [Avibacterium avium]
MFQEIPFSKERAGEIWKNEHKNHRTFLYHRISSSRKNVVADRCVRLKDISTTTKRRMGFSPLKGNPVIKEGDKFYTTTTDADGNTVKTEVQPKDIQAGLKDPAGKGGNVTLNNVASNLAPTTNGDKANNVEPTKSQTAPTADEITAKGNNSASVNDVLNAGWNLQGNGKAKDFVRAYDTVNFIDGNGTTAKVESDGATSTVTFDVKQTTLTTDANTGKVTAGNTKDSFATAKTVADAINNAGNQAKNNLKDVIGGETKIVDGKVVANNIGGTGENTIDEAIQKVNQIAAAAANTTVTAGGNIVVEKTGNAETGFDYKVSTVDDLKVNSLTAGNTKVDNNGVTFENSNVALNDKGLSNGGNVISDVKTGFDGKSIDTVKNDPNAAERNNAANIGDLLDVAKNVTNNFNQTIGEDFVNQDGSLNDAGKDALKTYDTAGQTVTKNENVISAIKNMNENGIKYFHTNDGQVASGTAETKDSSAAGKYSTAVGYNSKVGKDAENSVAIGANNEVNTANTYALGSNIKQTVANSVFLGNKAASAGVNTGNVSYQGRNNANVAGVDNVVGVVSVGNENETRQIQNVAAGVISATSTDAVNGSQLYDTHKNINRLENAVTNMGNELGNRINHVDRKLRAGVAGAVATAGLPQAYIPGKSMVAVAGGTYRGENAIAVGASRISDNGKVILKLTGSSNSRGDLSGSVGVGYQW